MIKYNKCAYYYLLKNMTLQFKFMKSTDLRTFIPRSIEEYAQAMVDVGEYENLDLPRQLATEEVMGYFDKKGNLRPNEFILDVYAPEHKNPIGILWFSVYQAEQKFAFIAWIETFKTYRSQGYAKKMLLDIEPYLKKMDIYRIELCVFDHNEHAKKLYQNAGYKNTGARAYGNAQRPSRLDFRKHIPHTL